MVTKELFRRIVCPTSLVLPLEQILQCQPKTHIKNKDYISSLAAYQERIWQMVSISLKIFRRGLSVVHAGHRCKNKTTNSFNTSLVFRIIKAMKV